MARNVYSGIGIHEFGINVITHMWWPCVENSKNRSKTVYLLTNFVAPKIRTVLSVLILTGSAAADFYVVSGLEDAANPMPYEIYRLEQDTGHLSPIRTITADCWFRTCVVDPDERFAVFWAYDMVPRTEVGRELAREQRRPLPAKPWMEHFIVVDLTQQEPDRVLPISHSAFYGNSLAYDPQDNLCAFTPDYEQGIGTLTPLESGASVTVPLAQAPWGRLVSRGFLYLPGDQGRINQGTLYRFVIDADTMKLTFYKGALDKEHKSFAASGVLPADFMEQYAASGCKQGWLECADASVALYRFWQTGADGFMAICDWAVHDRIHDTWKWKGKYDFRGYALLFDNRIVFYEGQWKGQKPQFRGLFQRTGRTRCTDLALNTLFEFELPKDAMVLNIIDDAIIYRTGTTLWALPIIDNQRVGEAKQLCSDPRLSFANWVAPAVEKAKEN